MVAATETHYLLVRLYISAAAAAAAAAGVDEALFFMVAWTVSPQNTFPLTFHPQTLGGSRTTHPNTASVELKTPVVFWEV